jgi:hypothetical protein
MSYKKTAMAPELRILVVGSPPGEVPPNLARSKERYTDLPICLRPPAVDFYAAEERTDGVLTGYAIWGMVPIGQAGWYIAPISPLFTEWCADLAHEVRRTHVWQIEATMNLHTVAAARIFLLRSRVVDEVEFCICDECRENKFFALEARDAALKAVPEVSRKPWRAGTSCATSRYPTHHRLHQRAPLCDLL